MLHTVNVVLIYLRVAEGGVREPATYHGLHALRPTLGSTSMGGTKVKSP